MIYILIVFISLVYFLNRINVTNLSYNLLYFVSLGQIKYNKIMNYLKELFFINNYNDDTLDIEYYKNGKIYSREKTKKHNKHNINLNEKNYDYVIISDNSPHKIFMYDKNISLSNFEYDISDIKFLSLNLIYNNDNYIINLKDNNHNFYIVNNQINKEFIKYYLENKLGVQTDEKIKYKLEIIDHNVNFINLTENESLIILKDNYLVK
jgi:hypothetical protein